MLACIYFFFFSILDNMPPPLKLRLRGYLNNTGVDTSLDACSSSAIPKKSSALRSEKFREELKKDPERYKAFCAKDAARSGNRRKHMTKEQRIHYNHMAKLRMRKKKESDREKTKNDKTKTTCKTRAGKKQQEERREKDRLRKQLRRESMTAEERAAVNKKRREQRLQKQLELQQIRLQKREHALRIEQLEREKREVQEKLRKEKKAEKEKTNIANEQRITKRRRFEARRKAIQRARAGLPKSPSKFAKTVADVISSATPRKKEALKNNRIGSVDDVEKVFTESVAEEMRSMRKQRSIKNLEWKRSLMPMIKKMKQYKLQRRASKYFGVTSKSINKANEIQRRKTKKALDQAVINKVVSFYEKSSVTLADKKLISKRTLKKTAFLQRPIRILYENFKAENPSLKIGLTKFAALRPRNIKPVGSIKFQGCLCTYCCNVDLKVAALNKLANSYSMKSMFEGVYGVYNATMCPKGTQKYHKSSCIQRRCGSCGVHLLIDQLTPLIQQHGGKEISWRKWERKTVNAGGKDVVRQELVTKTGKLEDCISELQDEVEPLSTHLFHAMWQHSQYSQLKSSLPKGWVLMVADFAENYTCRNQQEIQSAHWSHNTVTIHPIVCTYHCPKCDELMDESLIFITADVKHDYNAVNTFMCTSVEYLQNKLTDVQQIVRFSDGAACQYKSKGPFTDVAMADTVYKVPTSFHYYGSCHGKGPSDGESAVVKRSASQAALARNVVMNTAEDLFLHCKEIAIKDDGTESCLHFQRTIFFVEKIDRDRGYESCDIRTLKGTRSLHAIRGNPQGVVWSRNVSCFCQACLTEAYEDCLNKEYVDDWKESVIFTRPPRISVTGN